MKYSHLGSHQQKLFADILTSYDSKSPSKNKIRFLIGDNIYCDGGIIDNFPIFYSILIGNHIENENNSSNNNNKNLLENEKNESDNLEITEKENNAIIVASYGTFSTGINIKNLHNVIFASPSKSRLRNLQSIGRVLRKGKNKTKATLYDISDDCTYNSRKNYTLNHLIERIKIYNEENFNYEIITIQLKKNGN